MKLRHTSRICTLAGTILVLAAIVAGCNKGRSLIDEAKELHQGGKLTEAVATLKKVEAEAGGTPEVAEAKKLAMEWLIHGADEAKGDEKRKLLTQALSWDTKSGQAQARVCALDAEEKKYEALRKCIEGLDDMQDVPEKPASAARKALTEHDKEQKEASERKALLASEKPADWKALVAKFPEAAEAKEASQKLFRSESLCADSERFVKMLRDAEREMRTAVGKARATDFKPLPTLQLISDAQKRAKALKKAAVDVQQHRRKGNEAQIQKALVRPLEAMAEASQAFHDGAQAALDDASADSFNRVILTFEAIMRTVSPTLKMNFDTIQRECRLTLELAKAGKAPAAAGATAVPESGSAPDGPVGPDITAKAIESINASTAYPSNKPEMAIDGKPFTSWSGSGGSPWLEVGLRPGTKVDAVEFAGGRTDKYFSVDRWTGMGVIAAAEVIWNDAKRKVTFDRASDRGVRKKVRVGAVARTIRIQVLEVAPGSRSANADIANLKIYGSVTEPTDLPATALSTSCKAGQTVLNVQNGKLSGGSWRLADDKVFTFEPGRSRVDDGHWHSVSIKYEREKLADDMWGFEAAGTVVRFKVDGKQIDVTVNGKAEKGDCS